MEYRSIALHVREASTSSDEGVVEGVALKYGILDSYDTIFDMGCVSDITKPVKLHRSHDPDKPIGQAQLLPDAMGLRFSAKVMKQLPEVIPTWEMIKAGLLDGASIGFNVNDSYWDGEVLHFRSIDIVELSIVSVPGVPGAMVDTVRGEKMTATQTRRIPSITAESFTDDDILAMPVGQVKEYIALVNRIKALTKSDEEVMDDKSKTDPNEGVKPEDAGSDPDPNADTGDLTEEEKQALKDLAKEM